MSDQATATNHVPSQPDQPQKKPLPAGLRPFDSARAREATMKGHAMRRQRLAEADAEREQLLKLVKERQLVRAEEAAKAELERMTPDDRYRLERLNRVRKQIKMLDQLIEAETVPDALSKLATASAKLAEQERLLAGRPTPGARKPAANQTRPEAAFEPE